MELYQIADLHIGDMLFEHHKFYKFCQFLLEKENRYAVINGDIINNNIVGGVGSVYDDVISPGDQKREAKRMLAPIRDRILVLNIGNHEYRTKKLAGQDVGEEIAEALGVPYGEDEALLVLGVGETGNSREGRRRSNNYSIYLTHGCSGGKRPGQVLNNVEDLSRNILADVYMVGHAHRKIGHKAAFRYYERNKKAVVEMDQLYVVAAGWLAYGGYSVRKSLRPQVRGAHPVTLWGTHKEATTTL